MATVTPPLEMTDERLTDCSVPEPDTDAGEAEYNDTAVYGAGDQVISVEAHWIWESAADANEGNALPAADESNAHWLSVGPTNRWRALDLYDDTASTGPSPWTMEITPGKRINTIVLAGLVGDHITIEQLVDEEVIWSYEADLVHRDTTTWTEYLTGEFLQTDLVFQQDLLPLTGAKVSVEITRDTGDVSVGALIIGTSTYLGDVEVRPEAKHLNFSDVTRDLGGRAKMNRRRSVPETSQRIFNDQKEQARKVRRLQKELDAVVAFWAGLSDGDDAFFGSLAFIGFATEWTIVPDEGETFWQTLNLQGY